MELLYYYALAHQDSFDVRWVKKKSIQVVKASGEASSKPSIRTRLMCAVNSGNDD